MLLEAKDIVKQYGDFYALKKANISVPKNSIYGLLGPNGAGKTSLMRIINQITVQDSGEIIFDNKKLQRNHIKDIGYLPEERGLYKKMNVKEQCLYLAQLKDMPYNKAKNRLNFWFDKLNITSLLAKKVEELSKGMAQKIQFITAIIHEPKLLIFDEPFSGFDPINASVIKHEILELHKNGTTIIFSTHRMESVEEICTHIGLINNAKTILEGPINEVKSSFYDNSYEIICEDDVKLESSFSFETKLHQKNKHIVSVNNDINYKNFMQDIISKNKIVSFQKKNPTVESIFIKAVQNG
ncbi:MAG: ABC transporter ATP-binding protein [Flavobacteriales bacterium]|nr:ABC transporter ATP-binding protein [Flavobacteriales bacterium]|tara:strand:+ start:1030 stop:1920 length:891 start_codon:yes stop_codon:yes gene_type:complete